ncbi:uncharacterized protein ACA1_346880 [Acanthamoeba castellanii str. Neff]|uniref:Uncharacterized protein n=1 Tax=Acanthamoeba castellanii (strain ATCC 30010 / Neff) TaxID=1257118 RepID=L8GIB8_ACACF|nr:uncharacterized protein ACA1_346880 [Acanthamoeba castellanii str. Neff]ELR12498.1 hypothetical protein ACA1_346880 [Acanthamoeba castellanii str. Neff]
MGATAGSLQRSRTPEYSAQGSQELRFSSACRAGPTRRRQGHATDTADDVNRDRVAPCPVATNRSTST